MNTQSTKQISIQKLWQDYSRTRNAECRNELIEKYSGLVKCIALKIVGRYQYFNYMDDIINEGLIALLNAVEKFDPEKKVKFETFASIKIRGAMIDYIRKQDCFPRRLKKLAKTINQADESLNQRLGRNPTDEEMADCLGVDAAEYEKMLAQTCSLNMVSFEELVYEKGIESFYIKNSDPSDEPEQMMADKELRRVLVCEIENLDEKEKIVISLYYKEQLKIKEIAGVLCVSESRVSQIHSKALYKLKKRLEAYMKQ